ncbi:MAG: hypothetical protein IPQ09_17840 [Myxococcales bacterium]|jgi:hypothetical protein|nr:hypothetical protein [Myxococcales bacterium]
MSGELFRAHSSQFDPTSSTVPGAQWNITHSLILIAGVKLPNAKRVGPVSGLVELTYEFETH